MVYSPSKKTKQKNSFPQVRGFASRALVLRLLREVHEGKRLSEALAQIQIQDWKSTDIAFARLLLMQSLRFSWAAEKLFLPHMKRKAGMQDRLVLTIAGVSLVWLEQPAHAVLSISTALAAPRSRGFIHALVQRMLEDWQALEPSEKTQRKQDLLLQNAPIWSIKKWQSDWPLDAINILKGHSQTPSLDMCFKSRKVAQCYAQQWQASQPMPQMVRFQGNPRTLAGYREGLWWVQDFSAQIPVWLLRRRLVDTPVLDMCAAPGGKTAQLVSYGAKVTALDQDGKRLERLKENMERLDYSVEIVQGKAEEWEPTQQYPIILLDAPCSASGTIRRHPDILLRDHDPNLRDQQKRLFSLAHTWLQDGGILLYSVCSLNRSEGWDFIPQFAEELGLKAWKFDQDDKITLGKFIPEHRLTDSFLQSLPHDGCDFGGMDSFFIAAFQK